MVTAQILRVLGENLQRSQRHVGVKSYQQAQNMFTAAAKVSHRRQNRASHYSNDYSVHFYGKNQKAVSQCDRLIMHIYHTFIQKSLKWVKRNKTPFSKIWTDKENRRCNSRQELASKCWKTEGFSTDGWMIRKLIEQQEVWLFCGRHWKGNETPLSNPKRLRN